MSSFGIGGTNAHVIVEEAPPLPESDVASKTTCRPYQLLTLSAKTSNALEMANNNLLEHLERHPDLDISDVAYTLHVGRESFDHRRMLVCHDTNEALEQLRKGGREKVLTGHKKKDIRQLVFMFSGQGSQYVNMGLDLYQNEPTFRDDIDFCAEILEPQLGLDLRKIIFPSDDDSGKAF